MRAPQWLLPTVVIGVGGLALVGVIAFVVLQALERRGAATAEASAAPTGSSIESAKAEPAAAEGVSDRPLPPRVFEAIASPDPDSENRSGQASADDTVAQPGEQPTAAGARREAPPSEREVRSAIRRVPITMYTTSWCPRCTEARRWFQHNAIPFTEHDIERDPDRKRAMTALNPAGGVPTIEIDGQVVVGWSESRVAGLLAKSVKRRLGRSD